MTYCQRNSNGAQVLHLSAVLSRAGLLQLFYGTTVPFSRVISLVIYHNCDLQYFQRWFNKMENLTKIQNISGLHSLRWKLE